MIIYIYIIYIIYIYIYGRQNVLASGFANLLGTTWVFAARPSAVQSRQCNAYTPLGTSQVKMQVRTGSPAGFISTRHCENRSFLRSRVILLKVLSNSSSPYRDIDYAFLGSIVDSCDCLCASDSIRSLTPKSF